MNKKSVLIVDDEKLNRKILFFTLKKYNYNILEAENGLVAKKITEDQAIDLIILDLTMPIMDGFEFLNWIKNTKEYKNIPIIVSSALSDIESIKKALNFGCFDYLEKPLSNNILNIQLPLKVKNAINYYNLLKTTIENRNKILEQKKLLERELELAAELQRTLLPSNIPQEYNGFEISFYYQPSTQLGGDFYDFNIFQNSLQLLIADVSGHGTPSALITAAIKSFYNSILDMGGMSPNNLLDKLNSNVYKLVGGTDFFVTALYCDININEKKLLFSNAGHHPPIIYSAKKNTILKIDAPSFFLGLLPTSKYKNYDINIDSGDIILFYTDGISEAKNYNNEEFGKKRLQATISNNKDKSPKAIIENILKELGLFLGTRKPDDDITLIVIKIK